MAKATWRSDTVVASMHSGDLGIGVKSQSNLLIAGSSRNVSQHSLTGDSWRGKALIGKLRKEISGFAVKLIIC